MNHECKLDPTEKKFVLAIYAASQEDNDEMVINLAIALADHKELKASGVNQ
jgi:hypothetical protein